MRDTNQDVREFRAWARRIRKAERRGIRGRVRALRDAAGAPRRFVRAVRRSLGEYGDEVARQWGVGRTRQVAQVVADRLRYGLDPIAYYRFRLYLGERRPRAGQFVQTADVSEALNWLVRTTPGYPGVFRDKRLFGQWCAHHGLPFIRALMECEGGAVVREADPLPAGDLFSKPSDWEGGRGARPWIFDAASGTWRDQAGRAFSPAALRDELARESVALGRPILLQRMLRNHSSLDGLVSGGLCTARVMTVRFPGQRAELLQAAYRMPVAPSFADNFYLGGVAAPINAATGRLGVGIRKYPRVSGPLERHPDTGSRITGVQLPHWPETVALVLRAHDAVDWDNVPALGWDVAIAEEGPVLVEGNNRPCSTFAQMTSGVPLGATPFVSAINTCLRRAWRHTEPGTRNAERGARVGDLETATAHGRPPIPD